MVWWRVLRRLLITATGASLLVTRLSGVGAATASALPVLILKHQAFEPQTLTIPAGQQIRILVRNEDALPAEFESSDLSREKVIPGGTALPVYIGPLNPGRYQFFNDFHPSSTGTIVVVQPEG
jgi:plastocyanin